MNSSTKQKRKRILTREAALVYSTNPATRIAAKRLNYTVFVKNSSLTSMIVGYAIQLI
jgi:hypothetical protein